MGNVVTQSVGCKRRLDDDDNKENENNADGEDENQVKKRKLESTLGYMYKDLFCKGEGSDITIQAFNKQWQLHRLCLSKVDYFKNMFQGSWTESQSNRICFYFSDDLINEEAFSKSLESLYTDEVDLNPSNAPHILAVASWFGMDDLMRLSVNYLLENMCYDSVLQNNALADKYNKIQLKQQSVEFLAYNLFIKSSASLLRDISVDVMRDVLTSNQLCVLHLEQDVYYLLKKWLFLKLNSNWTGSLVELCTASQEFFKDFRKDTPAVLVIQSSPELMAANSTASITSQPIISFLETDEGTQYKPAFEALRFEHAVCSRKFCQHLKFDNIIPKSWQISAYEKQWNKLMKICDGNKFLNVNLDVENEVFERLSNRCGRVLKEDSGYCWRWIGFNFGCDLIFYWYRGGSLVVKRNLDKRSSQTSLMMVPVHAMVTFLCRFTLFSLSETGARSFLHKTGIIKVALRRDADKEIINLNCQLKYPIFLSCRILHSFDLFDDDSSNPSRTGTTTPSGASSQSVSESPTPQISNSPALPGQPVGSNDARAASYQEPSTSTFDNISARHDDDAPVDDDDDEQDATGDNTGRGDDQENPIEENGDGDGDD